MLQWDQTVHSWLSAIVSHCPLSSFLYSASNVLNMNFDSYPIIFLLEIHNKDAISPQAVLDIESTALPEILLFKARLCLDFLRVGDRRRRMRWPNAREDEEWTKKASSFTRWTCSAAFWKIFFCSFTFISSPCGPAQQRIQKILPHLHLPILKTYRNLELWGFFFHREAAFVSKDPRYSIHRELRRYLKKFGVDRKENMMEMVLLCKNCTKRCAQRLVLC